MIKIFLFALLIVMAIYGTTFAGGSGEVNIGTIDTSPLSVNYGSTFSPSANVNNLFTPVNVFTPVNANSNIQGQVGINVNNPYNYQIVAPKQTVLFESPTLLLNAPSQGIPELNFGSGKMIDATKTLPNFAIYGIKQLGAEPIRDVLSVNANVKFKNLYRAILNDAKEVANGGKKTLTDVRYQVIRVEAQKSWGTGGNVGGAGSVLSPTGLGGASGAGSIIPQWGGTKADDLFTIIFVKVVL